MIHKVDGYKNGYVFSATKSEKPDDEIFQDILKEYKKSSKGFHCLICNKVTSKNFRIGLFSDNIITINNKIADGCFFINGCY